MNFVMASDGADDNSIIAQESEAPSIIGDSNNIEVYVDPSQSGGGNGTKDSPYNSIQAALDNLDSGKSNTIILKDGNYTGESNSRISLIGNLTIKADEGAKPIITGSGSNDYWTLTGSNVLLQGITFISKGVSNSDKGFITASDIGNLTISGCTFENSTNSRLIYLNKVNNAVIEDCTMQNNYLRYLNGGVYAVQCNNLTFSGNLICNQSSAGYYGAAIYSGNNNNVTVINNRFLNLSGGSGAGIYSYNDKKLKIQNNSFDNIVGTSTYSGIAVYITSVSEDIDFINNTVSNTEKVSSGSVYIYLTNGGNLNISNNDFINNSVSSNGGGIYVSMYRSGNLTMENNNFINNSAFSSRNTYGGSAYVSLSSNVGQTVIKNNTFVNSSVKGTSSYGGSLYIDASLINNLTVDNNIFINSTGNATNMLGGAVFISAGRPYSAIKSTVNFTNNKITNSQVYGDYGDAGVYVSISTTTNYDLYCNIINNTFEDSFARIAAGLEARMSNGNILNNTFINLNVTLDGGALGIYYGRMNNVSGNKFINNSANRGGAIYIDSQDNNIFDNVFIGNYAGEGGAVYCLNGNNIYDNEFYNNSANMGGALKINSNNHIHDNLFVNNSATIAGGVIYSNIGSNNLLDNNTYEMNTAQIGGAVFFDYYPTYPNIYRNTNNTISNSKFINNTADTAGAVVLYSSNSLIANSTFIGNNATRYGSGAVASGGKNNIIKGNVFENNTASLYAGAIGANDTAIVNNTFIKNRALQAGAILTINSTIVNNTFDGNYALRGVNVVYLDNYEYGTDTLIINNTGLPEGTIYVYDENNIVNVYKEIGGKFYIYDDPSQTSGTYSYQGYCIEQNASIPIVPDNIKYNGTWGILVEDLFFVRNSLDQSYVGDYLKVLIMKYQTNENYNIKDYIYIFTDGDYRNSRDPIVQDVIKLAENCFTILDNGNNTIEGKTYCCEFYSFINPTTRQNMILWNCCKPIEIPTLTPSKQHIWNGTNTYMVGDNVTFRIKVSNDKNFTLHNVTIRENVPTGFSIVDWINTYSDDLERVSDTVWVLKRALKPGEKVEFDVILRYDYYYSSNPSNSITAFSLETDSYSASSGSISVETGTPELIVTKRGDPTQSSVSEGSIVYFDIKVLNPGSTRYTGSITVSDYWSSSDYKYVGYESDYSWSVGSASDSQFYCYYYGGLDPGETVSIRLFFEAKIGGTYGYRYNRVSVNGYSSESYYYVYSQNTGVGVGKYISGPNPTTVGSRMAYTLNLYNRGGGTLYNAWIEDRFPEEFVFDGWSGSSDFVHSITESGAHRWTYTKPLNYGQSQSITVYFNMTKGGTFNNIAVAGADNYPNVTTGVTQIVRNDTLGIYKNPEKPVYEMGSLINYTVNLYNTYGYNTFVKNAWFEEHFPKEFIFDHWEGPSGWILNITENGTYRWTYNSTWDSRYSQMFHIYFKPAATGNFTNTVIIGAEGYENTTTSVNVTVVGPDIKLEKITNNVSVELGNQVSFTIRLTNVGTESTGGMVVREIAHPDLVYDHFTTFDVSDELPDSYRWKYLGDETWQYDGNLSVGQVTEFTVYYNTTKEGLTYNTVMTNNTNVTIYANNTTFVYVPRMEVEKIAINPITSVGGNSTFLVVVKNTGSSNLTNVRVEDRNFEGLIYTGYESVIGNWSFVMIDGKYYYTLDGYLASGENASFIVKFNTTKEGTFTNYVGANASEIKNEIPANDTVLVVDSNMEIQKITIDKEIFNGESVTFTIVVRNTGKIDLTGITVLEQFDEEALEYLSFNGTNWSYNSTSRLFKLNQTLAIGQTSSFNITFMGKQPGSTVNTINVTANEYGNKTTSNTTFIKVSNYTVEKTLNDFNVTVGDSITYTIVVTNNGNYPLNRLTLVENYPSALEFVSVNSGWSTSDNRTFVYDSPLAAGSKAILNITFKAVEGGNVTNVVTVGNKTANNTTFVRNPKLDIQKISLNRSVDINDEAVFTIVVTNTGNVDLDSIVLTENYPAGLEFIKFDGDWTTVDNKTFRYGNPLPVGESIELNITFKATVQGNLTNIVSVKSNETKDIFTNNTTFVKAYNFTVEKLSLNKTVALGETVVYTIVITNTGSVEMSDVTAIENYPSALEFVSVNSGWSTNDNRTFVYDSPLAAGSKAILNITFKAVEGGNVTNVVTVGNKSSNNTTFVKDYRFIVEKMALDKVVSVGDEVTYIIKVTNIGNCNLTSITVTEKYSNDLKFIKYLGDWSTSDNRTFISTKPLKEGCSSILSITFKVLGKGNITNPIVVVTHENKTNVPDNETIFSKYASISVKKYTVTDTVYVGNKTAFDIVVTNTGNVDLENIVLTENYPKELILDAYSGKGWSRNGDKFTYKGILKPGESITLRVIFNTTVGGVFVNEVQVRSDNVSDYSYNITRVIYKEKPTPVKPVKPTPVKPIIPPFIPVKHQYHIDNDKENELPENSYVLAEHPTANPFALLLLMILILSIICLIRVKSVNVEINNKNFLYLMLIILLVFVSAGCVVAADVDDSGSGDLGVSVDEAISVEVADVDEVVESYDVDEVVVSYDVAGSSDSEISSSSNVNSTDEVYQAPEGSVIYVNPDAGSSGDGSYSNPYNSINSALSGLDSSSSNTIVLMDGIYKGNENTQLSNISGNIIMMADNGANPIIDFENTANNWNFAASHVMLNGITFTNANNSNGIISTVGNVNNYSIVNCSFKSNKDSTLLNLASVSNVSIEQCTFASNLATVNGRHPIISSNANNVSFTDNIVHNQQYNADSGVLYGSNINNLNFNNNSISEVRCINGCLYLTQSRGDINISGNILENITGSSNMQSSGSVGYISSQNSNIYLLNNEVKGCSGSATSVYVNARNTNVVAKNNIFNECSSKTRELYVNANSGDVILENNTFTTSSTLQSGANIYHQSSGKISVLNNSFVNNTPYYSSSYGGSLYIYANYGDGIDIVGNEFINSSATYYGGSLYVTASYSRINIENNTFVNSSSIYGGSTYISSSSSGVSIVNNDFDHSKADNYGGTIYLGYTTYYSREFVIENNTITNSVSKGEGGAIHITGNAYNRDTNVNVDIINNTIINSSSLSSGGAISWSGYDSNNATRYNFINNTVVNSTGSHGGAITTSFSQVGNAKDQFNVLNNEFINTTASKNAGAIHFTSGIEMNLNNNSFVNSTAGNNGGILYITKSNDVNGSISDNEFINGSAENGGAIFITGNNYNISNNEFRNNNATNYGGAIFTQKISNVLMDNNTFNNNTAQMGGAVLIDYPQNYGLTPANRYQNENVTISNSTFDNNSAELGGAVVVYSDNTLVANSTFTNNNATRYGSGALVSGGKNSTIVNNTFENNTAFLYGGAIGTNDSAIINNTFINNSAYQAGAILTINSTIVNNTFIDNDAKRGKAIVYLDTYEYKDGNNETLLENNTLPEGSVYVYNSSKIMNVSNELAGKYFLYDNLTITTGDYFYEGYCIEENASVPLRNNGTYGILIDDLSFVRNSLDQSYVGDYIKVLFILSKLNEVYNIHEYVTVFTDSEYWNSTDPYIQYVINLTESMTFNENNTVIINDTEYQFHAFINPTTRQNLILMNSSEIIEIVEMSILKTANVTKAGLDDLVEYTVTVTNDKSVPLNNLVIRESLPSGLSFVGIKNPDGSWITMSSNSWKLNRALKGYETVQLRIVAKVSSDKYNQYKNYVYATVDELPDELQASSTISVRQPHLQVNKVLTDSGRSYFANNPITFALIVYNDGEADSHGRITLEDSYNSNELEYVGFTSTDKKWSLSWDNNGRLTLNYNGNFKVGQVSQVNVIFKVKNPVSTTKTSTNYAYLYLDGTQVDSSSADYNLRSSNSDFYISKNGPSYASTTESFTYYITVNTPSNSYLTEFYVDEIFPSEWELMSYGAANYMVHTQLGPNHHRWTFMSTDPGFKYLSGTTIGVTFRCKTPGLYVNNVVGSSGEVTKNASVTTRIEGPVLSIEKIAKNSTVILGNQVTFTIRVNNSGTIPINNFGLTDIFSEGLVFDHFVDNSGKWELLSGSYPYFYHRDYLMNNQSTEFDVVFNTTKPGININHIQYSSIHGVLDANASVFVQNYELSVEKSYLHFYNTYDQNTSFVIKVKNTGNMNLTDVFVEESVFNGLNYINFTNVKGVWTVAENNGKYLFKLNGTLAPGEIAEFDVLFNTTDYGKLTNVVVAGSNQTDNVTANASIVAGNPSLIVNKTALNKTVYVGEEVTFTITVVNNGTMPLYGLTVKEDFPDNLEFVSSTGSWVYDSENRIFKLERALSACEPNNKEVFNVTFRAVKGGNATNIINVTNDIINKTANDTVYIYNPNFTVVKVAVDKDVEPNDNVYFTVVVTNTGNMNLTDIRLKEIYPDNLEYVGFSGNWSTDDNITFRYNGMLEVGNSTELSLIFKAVEGYNATNVVVVSTNETKFNRTDNETVTIHKFDFEVEKIALNKTVTIGDNVVYTVVITNTGNMNLTQIRLTEYYCEGLQFVSVNDGWTTSDNRTFIYTGSLLEPGEKAILNITFKTIAGNNMTNLVVVRTNETENKTAFNNTTYVINPEIKVEKLTLNKSVDIGDEVQFTIVVNNTGNVLLDNVTLVERYDSSRLEFVRITSEGWSTTDNITFVYADKLAVGDQAVLNITFKALDGGNAVNIVDVTTNETITVSANNTTFIKEPDFEVEKILLNGSVKVNDTIVYSVVVSNTGNINLTEITVLEEYPDSLAFISNSPNWETSDNKTFRFIGSLAPGDKAILNITFKAVGMGNVTNVVTVTTNETKDNKSTNNTTFVRYIDYVVSKVAVNKVVYVGDEATFIIKVTNLGNVDLKGIKVYENYPSSLKYIFHNGDWDTTDFREFTLTYSLAPGESTTLNITFKVLSMDNITNPIDVVFEDENKTTNDTIYAIKAEIKVDKISLNRTVYLGNQSGFDIIVTNTGNLDLTNVTLFENYPKELIFDSFVGENWTKSGNVFRYSGVLKAGESIKLFVLFNTTKVGSFVNDVTVQASVNNISEIANLTDELIEKLSKNLTDNSSNNTNVNVIYPEPDTPGNKTPDKPTPVIPTPDKPTPEEPKVHVTQGKHSTGAKSGSLESKATGNPLALLALMLVMLVLPLRRKK
ncbi:right-handed parallel beta-helix repeat-containing protein [uncultured Methanobrevibacter sp.]|uniref:DUF7507 domain-containing protein n=1 Tax=uncultured Methanobrevibacter sp. TaxID=253161 RepID=UPI00262C7614|nr:right-handed parallel beta-helix repeat-containing protein [uncultured Methanobrevibacter sp.]